MTASSRPPVGMPPHLWELAKRDARGAVPERIRHATDNGASAPASVRAIARRAATASATLGVAAAAVALGAGTATATPEFDTAAFDGAAGPPGPGAAADAFGAAHSAGGGGGPDDHHTSHQTHGSAGDGPVSSGLGSTFRVEHPDAPGPQHTLSVSIFQDVTVVETADGNFQVDAYQFIVVHDSHGHEYVFTEHFQVTVPDPPGQETDLTVHETGRVHIVENPDGSFTPVGVDHGIAVTVGSDGNGRDDVHIRQDESVRVDEHGRPDPHGTTVVLGERATSSTQDLDDPAHTSIDQSTSTGVGRAHPTGAGFPPPDRLPPSTVAAHPVDGNPGPFGGPTHGAPMSTVAPGTPVVFSGPASPGSDGPPTEHVFEHPAPASTGPGPFHATPDTHTTPTDPGASGAGGPHPLSGHPLSEHPQSDHLSAASSGSGSGAEDATHHEDVGHDDGAGHETGAHDSAAPAGHDGGSVGGADHLVHLH